MAVLALTLALAGAALPSAAAAEECPNAAFRTGPSAHLPDCRAYELVTPPYKAAGFARVMVISPSGQSAQLTVSGGFAGAEGFPNIIFPYPGVIYTTRRTDSGWVSTPDDLSSAEYLPYLLQGFFDLAGESEEGSSGQTTVWAARKIGQPENGFHFFMRRQDRSIVDIGPALAPTAPFGTPSELGASADVTFTGLSRGSSRYFFSTSKYHWPSDGTLEGDSSAYEYIVGADNTAPLLVGVDNSGAVISQCGDQIGDSSQAVAGEEVFAGTITSGHNAVSADGNTVFFTAAPKTSSCSGSGPPVAELFARIDNGLPGAHTVAVSEPSKEDCAACDTEAGVLANAHFQGASEDGSKVFFTTTQPLLGGDTHDNIYEYDFDAPAGERVVRVSRGDSTVSNPTPDLVQMGGSGKSPLNSEDGSHVYFIATGVLTRVANTEGESAEAGANNLYVFERDVQFPAGHIAFVARLSARDVSGETSGNEFAADATPNGRFLVFLSERDLTPDDTSRGVRQVFEYDAQTGALVRVSIGQDGFNHNGNVTGPKRNIYSGVTNDAMIQSPSRYYFSTYSPNGYATASSVSADGSYIFFQSTVGLTPQASDQTVIGKESSGGSVYANNIYEYHAGRVSLISDGEDVASFANLSTVELLGSDASGSNVFFQSADRLVGQDTDTNLDIYDARIDGGFLAPKLSPSCSGDACQGPLSAAPTLLSPGSEFQAGGNPPLAGAPAAQQKGKPKQKAKAKKRRPKGGNAGRGHLGRRGRKARGAVADGRANRKAGRS